MNKKLMLMRLNIKNISKKKLLLIAGCVVLVFATAGLFVFVEKRNADLQAQRLEAFEKEKAKKLSEIVAQNKHISEEAAKREQESHAKLQKALEEHGLTTAKLPVNCTRLQNRENIVIRNKQACSYAMRAKGTTKMAVVFISDFISERRGTDFSADIAQYKAAQSEKSGFRYVNQFLKREAARHSNPAPTIDLTFFGPYTQTATLPNDNYDGAGAQQIANVLQDTSLKNKVPESEYDLVHYVYLPQDGYFRAFAIPSSHRAFTSSYSADLMSRIFTHETLHLFGASDKYNNNDCETRGRGDPFNASSADKDLTDIMCTTYWDYDGLNINTITAREIGWLK